MSEKNEKLVIPGITDENTLVCLSRARKYGQYFRAVENALKGICPFCVMDRTYNQVIKDCNNWMVLNCNPPEKNTKLHFLFVPKRHVKGILNLSSKEWRTLKLMVDDIQLDYGIKSSGILIRDGDVTLSAGTVQHLHIHMMVPDGTGRVESPFYKGAESEAEGVARAIVFEMMRCGKLPSDLNEKEQKLIEGRI